MRKIISAAFVTLTFSSLFTYTHLAYGDLKMGIFPRRPPTITHQAFSPLAEKLSSELGEPVQLVVSKDFKTFWQALANKEFDLVHFNQYHYVKSHKEYGYRVLVANEEFGNKQIAGAITVRKDSDIASIPDLKGKTILFGGGKKAMGSYIAPLNILKANGLEPGTDFQVRFAKNPPNALFGVYNNAVDASGSGNVVLKLNVVSSKIDTSELNILAQSEPFTQLPWAVSDQIDQAKADKIQSIMTSLNGDDAGQAVLKSARVTNFFAVTDADYDKVRKIVKSALQEQY